MRINSNTTAVITGNYLTRAENTLANSSKKLSSGYKINNASDNPSGYALSSKMKAQIRSLEKACDNTDMATDFIVTADGALQEVHNILQRMNELAVKSSNGTMTEADRGAIDAEVRQLSSEIERIAKQTNFNDNPILDGTYEYRGYTDNENVKVLGYNQDTSVGDYQLSLAISVASSNTDPVTGDPVYEYEPKSFTTSVTYPDGSGKEWKGSILGDVVTLTGEDGTEVSLELSGTAVPSGVNLTMEKKGAMRVQVGDHEGDVIEMNIPEISLKKMGIDRIDLSTEQGSKDAITCIQNALDYTSKVRSQLGAYQNRLEHTGDSLDVTVESLNSSFVTLTDTDMAAEMTEYTKLQVLSQAATSMLAQANEFPQQALQLLQ
ncbi:MAG: flagellin FliC3 [Lachnospiraceae bacterium]|nr:flagellin FliC3 [Lachnospiraceae bacterium]